MSLPSSDVRFIAAGALLVAAILVATCLIIRTQRDSSVEAYRTAINNLGMGMARQTARSLMTIDRVLGDLQNLVASTPASTAASIALAMREKTTTAALLEKLKRASGVAAIALVDQRGEIANASYLSPLPNFLSGFQEGFAYLAAHDDPTAYVDRPAEIGSTGEWTTTMARRVNAADGKFAGIVVAVLSLREWGEFYQVAMPANRTLSLARRDGMLLVQHPSPANGVGTTIPELSLWSAAVAKGGGSYVSHGSSRHAAVIASVNPLPNLPFVVEAAVLERDALAGWYQQRTWLLAGGAAAIVSVVLLLWLFAAQYRRIRTQYRKIQVSEARLAEQNRELDVARGRLHSALSNISQGVCFFGGDQKLIIANDRYAETYGLRPEAIRPGISLAEIGEARLAAGSASIATQDEDRTSLGALAGTSVLTHFTLELRNGRAISICQQPMPDGGWVATHEDITERREAEAKIAFLATHDVLTGLANRALLQERMDGAQKAAKRGEPFAVLCLDLDGFKAVNSSLGHQGGDELLDAVAKRLVACVRERDTVARTGGDEFIILLQNPSTARDAAQLAGRILDRLAGSFQIGGRELVVGSSIGIAVAPRDGTTAEVLFRCADIALYAAKAEGRGRFRFFDSQMNGHERIYA